jgi:uncharacterized membrane protein
MKKYFITGLVVLLPLAVTLAIVSFILGFSTGPFVGIVRNIFHKYDLLDSGFLFLSAEQTQIFVAQIIVVILLFFFTVLLGILTRWFFINTLIRFGEYILHRIPVVSSVYKTSQDVIRTVFGASTKSFKQVVLVPFPTPQSRSLGFITQDNVCPLGNEQPEPQTFIAVFVPTTPNPTSGFLLMLKPEDVNYSKMTVEEAFKYIISCGVIIDDNFKTKIEKPQDTLEKKITG